MANEEQIRSIAVTFSEFILKEMIAKKAVTSEFELTMLAKYYDKLIEKFINEKFEKGDDKNDKERNN